MTVKEERPERKQTDESLAVERAKSDLALLAKKEATEKAADGVVEHARGEADEVLATAREKADETLAGKPGNPQKTQDAIDVERVVEDETLRAERERADAILERERAVSRARLFPAERDKTDLYLQTERARSDDALANRDDFLGMVSHDLRDLLNGVVVHAAFLSEDAPAGDAGKPARQSAERILRSAARMNRLIGDLVDIASIDAGKLAIDPHPANAATLLHDAVETWGPPAATKGITLECVDHGPVPATLDEQRVLQILGNLITNAVKFSPRGSNIVLSVETVDGQVRFCVKDTGVGIPADKLEAVFERFWQVSGNDRRGLGLGLYISKCLAEAHGGKIWAESTLGAGTTLYFTVPSAV